MNGLKRKSYSIFLGIAILNEHNIGSLEYSPSVNEIWNLLYELYFYDSFAVPTHDNMDL